jgi:hypothetical protein
LFEEPKWRRNNRSGEIVPQSAIYTIVHDLAHADMPHEVTVIKPALPDLQA